MQEPDVSDRINARVDELPAWQGDLLVTLREAILAAEPEMNEAWKWDGPAWLRHGLVCTFTAYKKYIKLNFLKGAALDDPDQLLNSSFGGKTMRAIDYYEGDTVDKAALKRLVQSAAAYNSSLPK